jgi:hypothetical protein
MHPDSKAQDTCQTASVGRQSAAGALREKARRMHKQACALENLADSAAHIHGAAEEALWNLVTQSR